MGKHLGCRHIDDFTFEQQLISFEVSHRRRRTPAPPPHREPSQIGVVSRETPSAGSPTLRRRPRFGYVDWELTGVLGRELAVDPRGKLVAYAAAELRRRITSTTRF